MDLTVTTNSRRCNVCILSDNEKDYENDFYNGRGIQYICEISSAFDRIKAYFRVIFSFLCCKRLSLFTFSEITVNHFSSEGSLTPQLESVRNSRSFLVVKSTMDEHIKLKVATENQRRGFFETVVVSKVNK